MPRCNSRILARSEIAGRYPGIAASNYSRQAGCDRSFVQAATVSSAPGNRSGAESTRVSLFELTPRTVADPSSKPNLPRPSGLRPARADPGRHHREMAL